MKRLEEEVPAIQIVCYVSSVHGHFLANKSTTAGQELAKASREHPQSTHSSMFGQAVVCIHYRLSRRCSTDRDSVKPSREPRSGLRMQSPSAAPSLLPPP